MAEPIRTCIGCRRKFPKGELIRIVRNESGQVFVDETGRKPGRGAYVCPDCQCIELAFSPKKLNKILKTNLESEEIEHLKQTLLNLLPNLEVQ